MTTPVIQNSFTGGEWSPALFSRWDLARYMTATRLMENAHCHPHGGVSNRGGTQFIAEAKDSTNTLRLIPFQFSVVQSYVLEFSEELMRIYKDGGIVVYPEGHEDAGEIVEILAPYASADLELVKFVQSADVLYMTHPEYPVYKLTRTDHHAWAFTSVSFGASIVAPTNVSCSGTSCSYKVTAVNANEQESVGSTSTTGEWGKAITWTAVADAEYYNVYKDDKVSGFYGWIGQAMTNAFTEPSTKITPDGSKSPPVSKNLFNGEDEYPGVATFHEQRLMFGRTNNKPLSVFGSVTSDFENFNRSTPTSDDDSIEYALNSRQVNEIRWFASLAELIIGTSKGEWRMGHGGSSDALTPTSVKVTPQSQFGSSNVPPLLIGSTILFVAGSGDAVRDLTYSYEIDGYKGNDMCVLATHLFDAYLIKEWAYQQHPDSIVWAVRDDGTLLGLTYYREQDVLGWHRHVTDGKFESVACIQTQEGLDEVYVVVNREIEGVKKRYIERFMPRLPYNDAYEPEIQDAFFVDSGLSYDNPLAIEELTVLSASSIRIKLTAHTLVDGDLIDFSDVLGMTELNSLRYMVTNKSADYIELLDEYGEAIDCSEYGVYTEGGHVRKAITSLSGLDHLEGKSVVALANGFVIDEQVVSSGSVSLTVAASRVHVGLPYSMRVETLDLDFPDPRTNGTTMDKHRNPREVTVRLHRTRSLFVGPDEDHLDEVRFRDTEPLHEATRLYSGDKQMFIDSGSERAGRVFFKVTDPVPCTILSVIAGMENGEE